LTIIKVLHSRVDNICKSAQMKVVVVHAANAVEFTSRLLFEAVLVWGKIPLTFASRTFFKLFKFHLFGTGYPFFVFKQSVFGIS
jgi:hypothetical protein